MFETEEEYRADKEFATQSNIKRLIDNPVLFDRYMKGEYVYKTTKPMNIGTYVHYRFLNWLCGGCLWDESPDIPIVPNFDRRTKKGKQTYADLIELHGDEVWLTETDIDEANELFLALTNSKDVERYFEPLFAKYSLEVEEVFTGVYNGLKVKGKRDIVFYDVDTPVKVIDLKTTGRMAEFKHSVYKYRYGAQAVHYTITDGMALENGQFDFLTIAKDDHQIKVFKTDRQQFVNRAYSEFEYGINEYKKYLEYGVSAFFENEL